MAATPTERRHRYVIRVSRPVSHRGGCVMPDALVADWSHMATGQQQRRPTGDSSAAPRGVHSDGSVRRIHTCPHTPLSGLQWWSRGATIRYGSITYAIRTSHFVSERVSPEPRRCFSKSRNVETGAGGREMEASCRLLGSGAHAVGSFSKAVPKNYFWIGRTKCWNS